MNPRLTPDLRLVDAPLSPLGQRVPEPLHQRVAHLCDLVYEAGEPRRPSKMEMIAALLLAATTDADELVAILRRYGKATVGDALPQIGGDIITLPTRRSGPYSRGQRSKPSS